jgi:hypothetical protein
LSPVGDVASAVENALAAYSGTTAAPHEYFDHTPIFHSPGEPEGLHCWHHDRPEACWMRQIACNATLEGMGHLNGCRYVLHDRDTKFCAEFRETLAVAGVKGLRLS